MTVGEMCFFKVILKDKEWGQYREIQRKLKEVKQSFIYVFIYVLLYVFLCHGCENVQLIQEKEKLGEVRNRYSLRYTHVE